MARKFRTTSSNFNDVIRRKKGNVEKFLDKFSQDEKFIETPALCYGGKHENIARKKYIAYKKLRENEKLAV
jgi:hypothetical protein